MARKLTYKAAGVDIDLKQGIVPLIGRLAKSTLAADVLSGVGGFGAVIGLNGAMRMRQPALVAGTDSVGTKLKIAIATGRHDTVGIDCVAMCVNDVICAGARPLFFLDYIGTGKLNQDLALQLVKGVARGCKQAGASLVGGETAQLPGLYRPGEYDLVGFAVGIVERSRIPQPQALKPGDVLVGLASSGLHSNGFSLARKALLEMAKLKLGARIPELGCTLADELLRPTRIYAKTVVELFETHHLKAIANITGGGIPENVPRVLPAGVEARFERGSWPVPPIFALIEKAGKLDRFEMDRTFNNGLGMVAIFARADADRAIAFLRARKQRAFVVGELRQGRRGVSFA